MALFAGRPASVKLDEETIGCLTGVDDYEISTEVIEAVCGNTIVKLSDGIVNYGEITINLNLDISDDDEFDLSEKIGDEVDVEITFVNGAKFELTGIMTAFSITGMSQGSVLGGSITVSISEAPSFTEPPAPPQQG